MLLGQYACWCVMQKPAAIDGNVDDTAVVTEISVVDEEHVRSLSAIGVPEPPAFSGSRDQGEADSIPAGESMGWLNHVLWKLWPKIDVIIRQFLTETIQPKLVKSLPFLSGVDVFGKFSLGVNPPSLHSVHVVNAGEDLDVRFRIRFESSEGLSVSLGSMELPVESLTFHGELTLRFPGAGPESAAARCSDQAMEPRDSEKVRRVSVQPAAPVQKDTEGNGRLSSPSSASSAVRKDSSSKIRDILPGLGCKLFFVDMPSIKMRFSRVGRVPGLSGLVEKHLQTEVGKQLVLPNSLGIPLLRGARLGLTEVDRTRLNRQEPKGVLRVTVRSASISPEGGSLLACCKNEGCGWAPNFSAFVEVRLSGSSWRTEALRSRKPDWSKGIRSNSNIFLVYEDSQLLNVTLYHQSFNYLLASGITRGSDLGAEEVGFVRPISVRRALERTDKTFSLVRRGASGKLTPVGFVVLELEWLALEPAFGPAPGPATQRPSQGEAPRGVVLEFDVEDIFLPAEVGTTAALKIKHGDQVRTTKLGKTQGLNSSMQGVVRALEAFSVECLREGFGTLEVSQMAGLSEARIVELRRYLPTATSGDSGPVLSQLSRARTTLSVEDSSLAAKQTMLTLHLDKALYLLFAEDAPSTITVDVTIQNASGTVLATGIVTVEGALTPMPRVHMSFPASEKKDPRIKVAMTTRVWALLRQPLSSEDKVAEADADAESDSSSSASNSACITASRPRNHFGHRHRRGWTTNWLNHVLAGFWPTLESVANHLLAIKLVPILQEKIPSSLFVPDMFRDTTLGQTPPTIESLSVHSGESDVELRFRVRFESSGQVKLGTKIASVVIERLSVVGEFIVRLNQLLDDRPLIGGITVHCLELPNVVMDFTGVGAVPGLSDFVRRKRSTWLRNKLLFPKRLVFPLSSREKVDYIALKTPFPAGVLRVTAVRGWNMRPMDRSLFGGATSDPYLKVRIGHKEWCSSVVYGTLNPQWSGPEATHDFFVSEPEERIHITAYDKDKLSKDDFMGHIQPVDVATALQNSTFMLYSEKIDWRERFPETDDDIFGSLEIRLQWMDLFQGTPDEIESGAEQLVLEVRILSVTARLVPNNRARVSVSIGGTTETTSYGTLTRAASKGRAEALRAVAYRCQDEHSSCAEIARKLAAEWAESGEDQVPQVTDIAIDGRLFFVVDPAMKATGSLDFVLELVRNKEVDSSRASVSVNYAIGSPSPVGDAEDEVIKLYMGGPDGTDISCVDASVKMHGLRRGSGPPSLRQRFVQRLKHGSSHFNKDLCRSWVADAGSHE